MVLMVGDKQAKAVRYLALFFSALTFLLTLPLFSQFDTGTAAMQFVENKPWIEAFNINYHVGIDGFSMPLILLTSFITVLVIISSWEVISVRVSQ